MFFICTSISGNHISKTSVLYLNNPMKNLFIYCFFIFAFPLVSISQNWQQTSAIEGDLMYEKNAFYIQFKQGIVPKEPFINKNNASALNSFSSLKTMLENNQITSIEQTFKLLSKRNEAISRVYTCNTLNETIRDQIIAALAGADYVQFIEKIPLYQNTYTPNDPDYNNASKNWHLNQLSAGAAWDISTGCQNVVIAIVDDAVLTSHSELSGKIYTNANEIPNNGIDDDNNGYIDDVHGYDVADQDGNAAPPSTATNSFFTHGTHVAGIAAGSTDNGNGFASIGFNSSIMPVKTKSNSNTSPNLLNNPMQGVEYAIVAGADVINMSWGSYASSQAHQLVFNQAFSDSIVCVAAAGNDGQSFIGFPANYNFVISVGATNQSNDLAPFTNLSNDLDIFAPGVSIWSSLAGNNNAYGYLSGTSMATPIISGLAALMLCNHGGYFDVENCIHNSADVYTSTVFPNYIIRIANAANALSCNPPTALTCAPNGCELIANGSFESPANSNITLYSGWNAIKDHDVCSWETYYGTADCFPLQIGNQNNYAHILADGLNNFHEGIISNFLGLVPGQTYRLEFDYTVSSLTNQSPTIPLGLVNIGFINNNYNWTPQTSNTTSSTLILTTMTNLPVDFTYTAFSDFHNGVVIPDPYFNHYSYTFIAPSNIAAFDRLLINPQYTNGVRREMELDNISLVPVVQIQASAAPTTIIGGNCTNLSASGSGGNFIWEPLDEFTNPAGANQVACPDSTTTFIVTVYDSVLGCSASDSITIYVEGTNGIYNKTLDSDIKIYPNPVTHYLAIESPFNLENKDYRILNQVGQIISKGKLNSKTNNKIDLSALSQGFYYLTIDGYGTFEVLKE